MVRAHAAINAPKTSPRSGAYLSKKQMLPAALRFFWRQNYLNAGQVTVIALQLRHHPRGGPTK